MTRLRHTSFTVGVKWKVGRRRYEVMKSKDECENEMKKSTRSDMTKVEHSLRAETITIYSFLSVSFPFGSIYVRHYFITNCLLAAIMQTTTTVKR